MTSTTSTLRQTVNNLDDSLKLQKMSLEELKATAEKAGITLRSNDKTDIIDQLIAEATSIDPEAEPGMLVSLHSRTDEAKATIKAARNVILSNEEAGVRFKMLLKNREGSLYTSTSIGCRLQNPESLAKIFRAVSPLPDGSQDAALKELQDSPELYETPILVQQRRNNDGQWNTYVMLYFKKKQQLAEQAF